ncbi:MAG TPA: 50S ribosomal protein L3 [Thermoanaerobacterales bacterium]|nr:50S ribosomal protein L3 [Thermoanaerobacterales bacterium]
MEKVILGKKIGMTQIFDEDGNAIPVTIIQSGKNVVVQKKTEEIDGYNALQIGFEEINEHRANSPLKGHFKKAGLKPKRYLVEFRIENTDKYDVGQEIDLDEFKPGDKVDITGKSKGKGFTGPIKRWGFGKGPQSHGSKYHRGIGSLGATGPAKVFKGKKMAGRMGATRVTVQGLEVVKTYPERHMLLVKGAVPGVRNGLLEIRESKK